MRTLPFALAGLACLVAAGLGRAVDADPNKEYLVTPDAGPWMICAASYTGPEAAGKARDLVLDLRRHHNLPAYVFNRGDKERREQQAERDRLKQLCPEGRFRTIRIEEQFAVLVGGFKDMDSARRALDEVKKVKLTNKRLMYVMFANTAAAEQAKDKNTPVSGAGYANPLWDAFVVRNPTVPQERKVEHKQDPFLKKLNADEEYSLLKCKAPWTLAVAAYQGTSITQTQATTSSFLEKLFGSGGDRLDAGALNAHNLAQAMRKMGFEAYVLHTRTGSLVTVGAFSRSDDPRMKEVQQALAARMRYGNEVQLLPQPTAMEVPRP